MSDTDLELLARYTRHHSSRRNPMEADAEDAFAEIVRRHLDLVHSAALRQVRSPQLAEEVAQATFIALARHAPRLAPDTILIAWLYQVARREAIDVVRREARRQLREQIATEMNAMNATAADWTHIEPLLDEAMHALDETDRAAVLLRYFEKKSLREVGATLGTSENAAQKRLSRAVERLREFFAKRGVTVGASGLAVVISANAVQAAPVGLAAAISTSATLAGLSFTLTAGGGAGSGILGTVSQVARSKLLMGLAVTVLVGTAVFVTIRPRGPADRGTVVEHSQIATPDPVRDQQVATAPTQEATTGEVPGRPDPLKLLRAVASARQRIGSGSMELLLSSERIEGGRKEALPPTRLGVLFDGPRLRLEQTRREYGYTYSADEAEAEEIRKRADSMDKEAAVQAGLLKGFEAHEVAASDGATLARFRESDGTGGSTTVDDPAKGSANSASYFFDPRCLGLRSSLHYGGTIEGYLGLNQPKSVELIGEESVEGIPAWHVQVQSKHDETLGFWIDVARPFRLLKHASGSEFALSRYDDANPRDPIPTEVTTMNAFRNRSLAFSTRFVRVSAQFDLPVDPASFTLTGLGMPIGTDVSDNRIHRRLGYWTGAGLAQSPPRKGTEPEPARNLAELLALLENYPASPEALEAATWILLNTPDGPEVEQAARVMRQEHLSDTNLVRLCQGLERARHRCSTNLLEELLQRNPSAEVRANACYLLAKLRKEASDFGRNQKAAAEAEKLFERVIREFGRNGSYGYNLAWHAAPELSELRRLTIGKPAPEIEAEDLEGLRRKLSDYRGRVVVLTFWCPGYIEAPSHRKLVELMNGKPFAFLGVFVDDDLAKGRAEVEKYGITWPSFWDKRDGPISTNWNVRSWPNVWVLDRQGVIRHRNLRWRELDDAVDALLRE